MVLSYLFDIYVTYLMHFESMIFRTYTDLESPRSAEFYRERMLYIEDFAVFMLYIIFIYLVILLGVNALRLP